VRLVVVVYCHFYLVTPTILMYVVLTVYICCHYYLVTPTILMYAVLTVYILSLSGNTCIYVVLTV